MYPSHIQSLQKKKKRLLTVNKIATNSLNIVTKRFSDNILVATRLSL